jgi:hypothetical protein
MCLSVDQTNIYGDSAAALRILFGVIIHDPHHPPSPILEDAHHALNKKAELDDRDAIDGNFAHHELGQLLLEYPTPGHLIIR